LERFLFLCATNGHNMTVAFEIVLQKRAAQLRAALVQLGPVRKKIPQFPFGAF
jgi:hypothetical protein